MEMGLGKTATVLSALTPEHLPALVIAPKRVAEHVWSKERSIWRPDLSIAVAKGTPTQRGAALAQQCDVTVIGRDNIKDVPVGFYRTIVLDELSGFKSRSTQRWKVARKLTRDVENVWGLTGTPAPNGLMDLWAQVALLDGGDRLGKGITAFKYRYFVPVNRLPNGVIVEWVIRPGASQRIQSLISDICLSMSAKDYLDLPPVTHNEVTVEMPQRAYKVYKDMKDTLVADLRVLGNGAVHTAANAAVLTNKLSQISAGFLYSDTPGGPTTQLHQEKVKAVQEIVEGTGSPVLVFYRFKEEFEALRTALPEAVPIDARGALDRWNAREIPVLLAHPASAGHGLNLQHGGSTIIFTTLPWSLEEYQQSVARLARQGQTEHVVVHHVVSAATIDRAIGERLLNKTSVQEALMKYLSRP
jgi:SNF2 family DNA or RNA helicase